MAARCHAPVVRKHVGVEHVQLPVEIVPPLPWSRAPAELAGKDSLRRAQDRRSYANGGHVSRVASARAREGGWLAGGREGDVAAVRL